MNFLRKTCASLLSLFFVNFAVLALIWTALAQTYLDPLFYDGPDFQGPIYEHLTETISEEVFEQEPQLSNVVSETEMLQMIRTVLPAELLSGLLQDIFAQLMEVPPVSELVISNEELKGNIRMLVLNDEELSKLIDPSTIDYISSAVTIPLDVVPDEAQFLFSYLLNHAYFLFIGSIVFLVILLILVGWVIGPPLSRRLAWISGNLIFVSLPFLAMSFTMKENFSRVTAFDVDLIQALIDPPLAVLVRDSWILFALSVLTFLGFLFFRFHKKSA